MTSAPPSTAAASSVRPGDDHVRQADQHRDDQHRPGRRRHGDAHRVPRHAGRRLGVHVRRRRRSTPLTVNGEHITKLTLTFTGSRDRVRRPALEHRADRGRRLVQRRRGRDAQRQPAGQRQRRRQRPADRRGQQRARARQRERPPGRRLHLHPGRRLLWQRRVQLPRQRRRRQQQGRVGRHHGDPAAPAPAPAAAAAAADPLDGDATTGSRSRRSRRRPGARGQQPAGQRPRQGRSARPRRRSSRRRAARTRSKTFKNATAKSKLNLRKPFKKKKLPAGTKITHHDHRDGLRRQASSPTRCGRARRPKPPRKRCIPPAVSPASAELRR